MLWQDQLKGDSLAWLLEAETPAVRYLALRDLLDFPSADPELRAARRIAHQEGPIAAILAAMDPEGYWAKPGAGYNPKYRSTVWSIILLAQLGASVAEDPRIARACAYLLDHALAEGGQFSTSGPPSGTARLLAGQPLLVPAGAGLRRSPPGECVRVDGPHRHRRRESRLRTTGRRRSRYYAGKCGPTFACGANNKLPCAWGAVKVMLALGRLPERASHARSSSAPSSRASISSSASIPPRRPIPPDGAPSPAATGGSSVSRSFYVTDLLQLAEALVAVGYGQDPRLARTLALIRDKQDAQGRWPLEYDYAGKTWVDFGAKKQPNKWVTLRALRVLKAAAGE